MAKKYREDILLVGLSVIILAVLAWILHKSGAIMNIALSIRTVGVVGFVVFSLLAAFAQKVLRREKWAIRFAIATIPFFAAMAIINDW